MSKQEMLNKLGHLNQNFIDKSTRYIIIDTILYNPYTDFFSILNLFAKFEPNGLISPNL